MEASPSPSLSDSSSDDDEGEAGQVPLDHLRDIGGTTPGALASGPASLGGGGEDASGLAIARPGAEADAPEAWALGKHVVSSVGSMVEVEQAAAGAMQPPPQRVKGAPESGEGRPTPADTEAVAPPPPLLLRRMRDVVQKWLCPRSSQKHQAEAPALAPCKALKVSASSTAQWVMEAQAAIQRGVALARVDPKGLDAQGEATKAALQRAGDEAPTSLEAKARESDGAEAPSIAVATEGEVEAPKTSKAEATEAGASRTTEAEVAEAGAPRTTETEAAEVSVGLEKEVSQAAEASVEVQAVLEAKIGEHNALQSAARTACETLEVEGVESGSSLGSRLITLSGQVREQLRGALHTGVKQALAIVSSHYADIDLEAISDGYVLAEDDEEADEEVTKLVEAAKGPGTALSKLFEEEVVPPTPSANIGDPEP
ncbi:uncharacterized protein [Miscanthus floridulus]|uniref:uncharacterized protein n=1 Tax=Miscanthus floridulus TaxID=154761 RepID=UPI003459D347